MDRDLLREVQIDRLLPRRDLGVATRVRAHVVLQIGRIDEFEEGVALRGAGPRDLRIVRAGRNVEQIIKRIAVAIGITPENP